MFKEISNDELLELFLDTLEKCGLFLLHKEDEVIGYCIFEEFDIGIISYLHQNNLEKLKNIGYISDEIMRKSLLLRELTLKLQNGNEWNIKGVRNSSNWREILALSDEIKMLISKM